MLLEDHGWRTDRWTVNHGSRDGGRGALLEDYSWRTDRRTDRQLWEVGMEEEEHCWRTTVGGLTGGQTDNRGRGGWRRRRNAVGGPRLED